MLLQLSCDFSAFSCMTMLRKCARKSRQRVRKAWRGSRTGLSEIQAHAGSRRAALILMVALRQLRTGLSKLLGNTVSPPSSTSDRYMSIVARRWPPFSALTGSWK